ncbi:Maf family protein [Fluviispira multicolorata]|uniref:dTTP/UTP pyrophosphatase n=1 Tax=Fluviispira multicolorata TaxID=2654512 RepID=A0A833JHB8_9BACT|nr:Maf family protein [Fluviispira multicolorata]KAB8033387.1 septum formation inhibitor Maf [Fluviispira multicolorata]
MTKKKSEQIILASASPRRKEMLQASGIPFYIVIADIEEKPLENEGGHAYVQRNAREKAIAICEKTLSQEFVLSADTIVVTNDDKILEKPQNPEHAKKMLQSLSGNTHLVLSGYSLFQNKKEIIARVIETSVTFRKLSDREIDAYIKTGEPFDKAGSYGIQGRAMGFIEKIEGSYTNVMGLPLSQVLLDLKNYAGIETYTQKEA